MAVELEKYDAYSDDESKAITLVKSCKEDSLKFYEEKFKNFNYFDRLYLKGASKKNAPYGRANLELPLAFQQIEPFVSQLTETMVGEAPYVAYAGRTPNDDEYAEQITEFTQYQLETGNFVPEIIKYFRNLGKYGSAVLKIVWNTETLEVQEESSVPQVTIDPQTGQPNVLLQTVNVTKDVIMHDGPVFHNISLFDFFIPKSATSADVQKMEWVIHRTYRDLEELLKNPNYKKAHSRIKNIIDQREGRYSNSDFGSYTDDGSGKQTELEQKNPTGATKYEGKAEILEWWGDYSFKGEAKYERKPALIVVAVIGGDCILLRMEENPFKFKFKPFVMGNDYQVDGEAYGYGELHHIKSLIEESTALRNQRLDVANLSLNSMWLIERTAGINLRELYTASNKVILTNDNQGVKRLDMSEVTPSSVNELARIDYDIQNTTEIINPRQDVSNVGAAFGGTATGVNFLSAKSNLRLLTKARLLEETVFKQIARMINWYNKDLLTSDVYFRVSERDDNPYQSIGPEAFAADVDFKPTSNPQKLTTAERKDNMSYLLQVVAQMEKVAPGTNNLMELLKDVYKISGFPHPEKYVNTQPTQVLVLPNGQLVDTKGNPVQPIQVDENGQPIQAPQGGPIQ